MGDCPFLTAIFYKSSLAEQNQNGVPIICTGSEALQGQVMETMLSKALSIIIANSKFH